jgi:hypothetical protein
MNASSEVFKRHIDKDGEEYYCPVAEAAQPDIEDCVEASTAGRYSGNLDVVERFTP